MQTDTIINGDWVDVLKTMPDCSVHCGVTSPPYYGLRDYGVDGQLGLEETPGEYIEKLVVGFREFRRVLSDDGTLWINIADCYAGSGKCRNSDGEVNQSIYSAKQGTNRGSASGVLTKTKLHNIKPKDLIGIPWMLAFALRNDGWYLRSEIIWNKPNAMPESVTDRCTSAHEIIFMLAKSRNYYFDMNAIKEPAVNGDPNPPRGSKGAITENQGRRKQDSIGKRRYTGFNERYFDGTAREHRNKRNVWTVSTKPLKESHFATFPVDLIEPCILAGCPERGIVCDPFFGSGTTGVAAKKHNRHYVGIELNPEYIKIAQERLFHATAQQKLF